MYFTTSLQSSFVRSGHVWNYLLLLDYSTESDQQPHTVVRFPSKIPLPSLTSYEITPNPRDFWNIIYSITANNIFERIQTALVSFFLLNG